jgi:hypothetical protein
MKAKHKGERFGDGRGIPYNGYYKPKDAKA